MFSFEKRLELLEKDLSAKPPAFTMSVDLPFAIFRYDPNVPNENEWLVRREIHKLAIRVKNTTNKNVVVMPLSELYWQSIDESEGLEELVQLERARGFQDAEQQVSIYLRDPDWRPLTQILIEKTEHLDSNRNLLFLTRVGVFAPSSYRISSILEQLMGKMPIPAVLFYPGTWHESLNYLGLRAADEPLASYRVKIYGRES